MTRRPLHMSAEGETKLDLLLRLLESADGEGYEVNAVLNVLVLEHLTPPVSINSMNDMMRLDLRRLAPLAEALAAGVDKELIRVVVPGLAPGESLTYFEGGRKRMDVVKLMRLHFEASGDRDKQPLVTYAPGRRPHRD